MQGSLGAQVSAIIILGVSVTTVSYYAIQLRRMHSTLAHCISHSSCINESDILSKAEKQIVSLPGGVVRNEAQYVVLQDEASKVVRASLLPNWDIETLLTAYLRHNFSKFATTPQAWVLWLLAERASKKTFHPELISKLGFDKGDVLCGSYVVQYRQHDRVELAMHLGLPEEPGYVEGRLIIGLDLDKINDEACFKTQTLMWRSKDSNTRMPLERSLPRWAHELASWWLVEEGTKHLRQLKQTGSL